MEEDRLDRPPDLSRRQPPFVLPDLVWVVGLAGAVFGLYGRVMRLWWTYDDTFILRLAASHSPWEFLFSPRFWQQLPSRMFTPLLMLSFQLDLSLFGFRPFPFYAHHLASLATGVLVLFANLRRYLGRTAAGLAATLFLLGLPIGPWAQELACRHYVDGFVLAGVAVLLLEPRGPRPWREALSSVAYLLAVLAKEIYVPLPALLFFLVDGNPRSRLRGLRFHAAALGVYLAWRFLMLGTLVGGYGWIVPREQMLGLLLGLPLRVGSLLLPTRLGPALALAATAGGLAIFALARKRWLRVPAVILSVAVLGPLLAVSRALEPRFCALPWLILSVLCCQGWLLLADERRTARIAGSCALAVVLGSAFWSNRLEWRRGYAVAERMSEEGRAFLAMGSGDVLRRPAIPPGAMKQTVWLKSRLGRAPGAGWFGDDVYLCLRPPGERLWEYRERSGGVVRLSEGEVAAARAYCNRIRGAAPLAAHFEARGGTLTWLLGPYSDGRYSLVLDQGVEAFPVRPNDGYQTQPEQLVVMLRYESPEGWVTYSPQLSIDFRAKSSFDWTRP